MIYILAYCIGTMPLEQCTQAQPIVALFSSEQGCRSSLFRLRQKQEIRIVRRCEVLP